MLMGGYSLAVAVVCNTALSSWAWLTDVHFLFINYFQISLHLAILSGRKGEYIPWYTRGSQGTIVGVSSPLSRVGPGY